MLFRSKKESPQASEALLGKSTAAFRQKNGFFSTPYTGFRNAEMKPEFLPFVEAQFKNDYEMSISEFVDLSNKAMKNGLGRDISRYFSSAKNVWSDNFETYLKLHWNLLKDKSELSIESHNEKIWKRDIVALATNESIGEIGRAHV